MKKRKIWAGLSTAVLVAAPVASQAVNVATLPAAVETKADQGHGAPAKPTASMGGEGEGGASGENLAPQLHLYRGIEMIRGHLLVGNELIEAGRWADALPHFLHPEEEIYASLREDLKTFNVAPFQAALKSLSQTVKAKNKDAYTAPVRRWTSALPLPRLPCGRRKRTACTSRSRRLSKCCSKPPTNMARPSRRTALPTWWNTRMHAASCSRLIVSSVQ